MGSVIYETDASKTHEIKTELERSLNETSREESDRRRDAENARNEREEDMRNFRRMLDLPHQ